jgi:hypothetical protein
MLRKNCIYELFLLGMLERHIDGIFPLCKKVSRDFVEEKLNVT